MDDAVPPPFFRRGGAQDVHGEKRRDALDAAGDGGRLGIVAAVRLIAGSYPVAAGSLKRRNEAVN